jgi:DNA-binding Xre family transcriptional regulator
MNLIRWKFKSYLSEKHQIYSATELQKIVVKKTGVVISLAQLCKLVNRDPSLIRLSTMEVICSALDCKLFDILEIGPKAMKPEQKRKLSFKNTPKSKIGGKNFPSPTDYEK